MYRKRGDMIVRIVDVTCRNVKLYTNTPLHFL